METYFNIVKNLETKEVLIHEVEGERVNDTVFIFQDKGDWIVVDIPTGAMICDGYTKEDALIRFNDVMIDYLCFTITPGYQKAIDRLEKLKQEKENELCKH